MNQLKWNENVAHPRSVFVFLFNFSPFFGLSPNPNLQAGLLNFLKGSVSVMFMEGSEFEEEGDEDGIKSGVKWLLFLNWIC